MFLMNTTTKALLPGSRRTPYKAHLKKQRVACVTKEKFEVKSQQLIFKTSQKLLTERAQQEADFSEHYSYPFNFKGGLLCNRPIGFCLWRTISAVYRRAVSVISENYLMRFHCIFPFLTRANFCFVFLSRYTIIKEYILYLICVQI